MSYVIFELLDKMLFGNATLLLGKGIQDKFCDFKDKHFGLRYDMLVCMEAGVSLYTVCSRDAIQAHRL